MPKVFSLSLLDKDHVLQSGIPLTPNLVLGVKGLRVGKELNAYLTWCLAYFRGEVEGKFVHSANHHR